MSDQAQPGELDLERAQFDQPAQGEVTCQLCRRPPGASYYSLNGNAICASCLEQQRALQQSSFVKALLLGTGAGAVGAALYYGIREATDYNLGLLTIVLGIMVGLAVRRGAGGSQSKLYRLTAVALAWAAMCITYVPMVADGMASDSGGAGLQGATLWISAALFSMFVPFFLVSGFEVLGLIIFAFGLWEAWRLSAPRPFLVEGPFTLAEPATQSTAAAEGAPAPPG